MLISLRYIWRRSLRHVNADWVRTARWDFWDVIVKGLKVNQTEDLSCNLSCARSINRSRFFFSIKARVHLLGKDVNSSWSIIWLALSRTCCGVQNSPFLPLCCSVTQIERDSFDSGQPWKVVAPHLNFNWNPKVKLIDFRRQIPSFLWLNYN